MQQVIYSDVRAILEQHKYLVETLWNEAIPADQKIKEIEGVILSFIDTIADPNGIQKTIFDLVQTADHEILITYPTANAFHRQERLGVIKLLEEASQCKHQNSDT